MEVKTSPAKRAANDRWDKEHMTTLGCRVKKDEAELFKAYARDKGKTSNTVLKEFVFDCIGKNEE